MSEYRLQIVLAKTGEVVKGWEPGSKVETDLVEDLCGRVKDAAGVRKAFKALIYELKRQV